MNNVKQIQLILKELKVEEAQLAHFYNQIKEEIYFPEISQFDTEFQKFVTEDYIQLITGTRVQKLHQRLEFFITKTRLFKKRLIELSNLPQPALPSFETPPETFVRQKTIKKIEEPICQRKLLNLYEFFEESKSFKSLEEFEKSVLIQKITLKTNRIAILESEIEKVEKNFNTNRFIRFLKNSEELIIDKMVNSKPILQRRHFSVPQKIELVKLKRICDKQQAKVNDEFKRKDHFAKRRLFEYSLLMDVMKKVLIAHKEEQSALLHKQELKMILAKRKISVIYEDNVSIVQSLKDEIRNVKRSIYQKWRNARNTSSNQSVAQIHLP